VTKLETRIPAGFIGGVTQLIPQVRARLHLKADSVSCAGDEIIVSSTKADMTQAFLKPGTGHMNKIALK
jgi:hypothetical protein